MQTFLEVIQERHLDVLLQKEPKSKFLRTYLSQVLGTTELPQANTWEEWQEWLSTNPPRSVTRQKPICLKYHAKDVNIRCLRIYKAQIRGVAQSKMEFNFNFSKIVSKRQAELKLILAPLLQCRSLKALAKVNLEELQSKVVETLSEHLKQAIGESPEKSLSNEILSPHKLTIEEEIVLEENYNFHRLSQYVSQLVQELYQEIHRRLEEKQQLKKKLTQAKRKTQPLLQTL